MIRALSPYYITTNLTYLNPTSIVCAKYTLTIQVWNGLKTGFNGSDVESYDITFINTQADPTTHDININAIIPRPNIKAKSIPLIIPPEGKICIYNNGWMKPPIIIWTSQPMFLFNPIILFNMPPRPSVIDRSPNQLSQYSMMLYV